MLYDGTITRYAHPTLVPFDVVAARVLFWAVAVGLREPPPPDGAVVRLLTPLITVKTCGRERWVII